MPAPEERHLFRRHAQDEASLTNEAVHAAPTGLTVYWDATAIKIMLLRSRLFPTSDWIRPKTETVNSAPELAPTNFDSGQSHLFAGSHNPVTVHPGQAQLGIGGA